MMNNILRKNKSLLPALCAAVFFFATALTAEAASLSLSPATGVYTTNSTFTVRVTVNSDGASINAAEGTLKFNPSELSVVSANRNGSIFSLWVTEPTFSNSAGTVTFSGGSPGGYKGGSGTVMDVTFRAKGSGPVKVTLTNGSVLANDGLGTNVLSTMNGGTYTVQAAASVPDAEEVVVEYVAPANTPAAPTVTSSTHGDQKAWYKEMQAVLTWNLPADVTAVRTLLDDNATAIPTKVYDTPINSITLDLDDGVSYFHVQFKNKDGWGKVTHYRLAVDTVAPTNMVITHVPNTDTQGPKQFLSVAVTEETSEIKSYKVQVDSTEPFEYKSDSATTTVPITGIGPGYHTVVIEAFDEAGNSVIGSFSFSVEAFEAPVFTEVPPEITERVIPVIKGTTRPNATVDITLTKIGSEPRNYQVTSDTEGIFTFIPEGRFSTGVYEISARAIDAYGAQSEWSDTVRIAVQEPGIIRIGSLVVGALSVIIPLIILTVLAVVGTWYMVAYLRRFRRRVRVESVEALDILHREFTALEKELSAQELKLQESRKTKKLTTAEQEMIAVVRGSLQSSQRRVEKEITDVTDLSNGTQ
jgi:hypothetical protein